MRALSKIGIPVALLIGAAAGIAVGWGLGSWTTCAKGSGCELRLDAVKTVVALIGGIGTFVTLLIGVITFSRDSREKARATILDSRRSAIRMKPAGLDNGRGTYSKVQIEVTNQTFMRLLRGRTPPPRPGMESTPRRVRTSYRDLR